MPSYGAAAAADFKHFIFLSQTFLGRLGVVRETQGKLFDEIKTECSKYGDDVKYLADFTAGVKKFDPWIQMSEAKNKAGMKKPVDLEQATTEYNNAKVIPTSGKK